MDVGTAHKQLERERDRWFSRAAEISDDELLRRRERFFNGLTLFFGAAVLPSAFICGSFGGWGQLCFWGEIWIARRCSVVANQCRDAREILRAHT